MTILEIRFHGYCLISLWVIIILTWAYILYTDSTSTGLSTWVASFLIIIALKSLWWSMLLLSDIEGRIHLSNTGTWGWGQHRVRRLRTYASRFCTFSLVPVHHSFSQLYHTADWYWFLVKRAISVGTEMIIAYQHQFLGGLEHYLSVHLNWDCW